MTAGVGALPASSRWSLRTLPDVLQGTGHPHTARSNPAPDKTVKGKLRHHGADPRAALNLGQVINSDFLFCKMRITTLPSLHHLGGGGGLSGSFNEQNMVAGGKQVYSSKWGWEEGRGGRVLVHLWG